ncbi:molecular chaperone MKKS-like [Haliotis cracherodii]|uniref:molecular chaperone MKKS-like n=1 Tax=Haliotis cracherodii TaxID=6455 RepID=UPI0039E8C7B6
MAQPASRRERPSTQTHLEVDCLEDPAIRTRIQVFRDLLASCQGPRGKAKVIQNSLGGHVTWTKLSFRLLSVMSISTPVLKLITSAVQGHLQRFKDGGLFTANLCLSLLDNSLKTDVHRKLLIQFYERFVNVIDTYLGSSKCACKFEIDVFNLQQVMTLLRSLCGPKLSYMRIEVQDKLFAVFLDVFLCTIPSERQDFFSDRVHIQCFPNSDILESTCLKGLLIECPELSSVNEKTLDVTSVPNQKGFLKIKVAVVLESMSGDSEGLVDAMYETEHGVDVGDVVVERMLSLCQQLLRCGVGLLLCQRVIHPKVKVFLRQAGLLFVDRLGSSTIPYLRDLTGASPLSVLTVNPEEGWSGFGWLDSVTHQIWCDKSYLHLTQENSPIVTLILKSSVDEMLQEVKVLGQTSVHTLQLLLGAPHVLSGGGCWLCHVAAYLVAKVQEDKPKLLNEFECTESQLNAGLETFTQCLLSLALRLTSDLSITTSGTVSNLTDAEYCHIWKSPNIDASNIHSKTSSCNCGLLDMASVGKFEYISGRGLWKKQQIDWHKMAKVPEEDAFPRVVDPLVVMRNALKMAVATANTVLSICQYIHDGD